MDKYELVKQISQTCDMVERLMMENEMLKEQLKKRSDCKGATGADCINIEEAFGKAVITKDYKKITDRFASNDDFYVYSDFLEHWESSYPRFGYYENQDTWFEAVTRKVFDEDNHVLDNFTLPELKALFKAHLMAIYKEGRRKYIEEKKKDAEKNDD